MIGIITFDQVTPQPWRNGGGLTRELLTWPPDGAWSIRISVADIGSDGPFSSFPGVNRWFAVLQGAGVRLSFGARTQTLGPGSAPVSFDGAAAPGCELLDGPTRDLNLMIRSGAGRGAMEPVRTGVAWHSHAAFRAVFVTGPAHLSAGHFEPASLPAMSLAWSCKCSGTDWLLSLKEETSAAFWLSCDAHQHSG